MLLCWFGLQVIVAFYKVAHPTDEGQKQRRRMTRRLDEFEALLQGTYFGGNGNCIVCICCWSDICVLPCIFHHVPTMCIFVSMFLVTPLTCWTLTSGPGWRYGVCPCTYVYSSPCILHQAPTLFTCILAYMGLYKFCRYMFVSCYPVTQLVSCIHDCIHYVHVPDDTPDGFRWRNCLFYSFVCICYCPDICSPYILHEAPTVFQVSSMTCWILTSGPLFSL